MKSTAVCPTGFRNLAGTLLPFVLLVSLLSNGNIFNCYPMVVPPLYSVGNNLWAEAEAPILCPSDAVEPTHWKRL